MAVFHACKSSDLSSQIIISSGLTFAVHTLSGLVLLVLALVSKLRSITTWCLQKKAKLYRLHVGINVDEIKKKTLSAQALLERFACFPFFSLF